MIINKSEYLQHFGKKGMHWGQRKARKKAAKQERLSNNQAKATNLIKIAMKDPNALILLNRNTVVTGQEFVSYMSRGGLLDVKTSRVYAQQTTPNGAYVLS